MRLLYLVEQEHAVGCLPYGVGEQSAVLVAHIACRRADELGHGVLLGILAHVEPHELHAHFPGEHACHLGLSHTGGSHEEQAGHRFVLVGESGLRHLHGLHHLPHGLVLSVYLLAYAVFQCEQHGVVVVVVGQHFHLAHLGEHLADERLVHQLLALPGVDGGIGSRLVDEVDGLVGQAPLVDILGAQAHGLLHGALGVGHAVKLLEALFQSLEYAYGLLLAGLRDVYLLEPPHHAAALGEVAVELLVGGAADEPYASVLEIALEHVRGVHGALAGLSGAHQVVNLVDIGDGVGLGEQSVHHHLHAFLEVAPELRSGQERAQVDQVDACPLEPLGHLAFLDACRQSVDEGCLSHARLTHMERVVLVFPAQHLYGALQLGLAPYERVGLVEMVVQTGHQALPLRLLTVWPTVGHGLDVEVLVDEVEVVESHHLCEEEGQVLAHLPVEQVDRHGVF